MDNEKTPDLKSLKSFFQQRAKEAKTEKDQVLSIIGPHMEKIESSRLSETDKSMNKKELIDLGKFLSLYDRTFSIHEAIRESPDFLIQNNQSLIGVELCDIYTDFEAKKNEGATEKLFKETEQELIDRNPDIKGVFKISFIENISFTSQQSVIKDEIIDCISSGQTSSEHIKSIDRSPGSALHLFTNEASSVGPLRHEVVLEALAQKEEKLNSYKPLSNTSEFWLLLVLGGLKDSSNYSFMEKSITEEPVDSGFDKVFIVNFCKSDIVELKKD